MADRDAYLPCLLLQLTDKCHTDVEHLSCLIIFFWIINIPPMTCSYSCWQMIVFICEHLTQICTLWPKMLCSYFFGPASALNNERQAQRMLVVALFQLVYVMAQHLFLTRVAFIFRMILMMGELDCEVFSSIFPTPINMIKAWMSRVPWSNL